MINSGCLPDWIEKEKEIRGQVAAAREHLEVCIFVPLGVIHFSAMSGRPVRPGLRLFRRRVYFDKFFTAAYRWKSFAM